MKSFTERVSVWCSLIDWLIQQYDWLPRSRSFGAVPMPDYRLCQGPWALDVAWGVVCWLKTQHRLACVSKVSCTRRSTTKVGGAYHGEPSTLRTWPWSIVGTSRLLVWAAAFGHPMALAHPITLADRGRITIYYRSFTRSSPRIMSHRTTTYLPIENLWWQ
jgi:hypothetical protein